MSKLYIFGIGGTGSRVLKSLTMLLAAGVKINAAEIVPVIIDPDHAAADLTRTVKLMRDYNNVYGKIAHTTNSKNGFCRTRINLDILPSVTIRLEDTENGDFKKYIGLEKMKDEKGNPDNNYALASLLFSENNLNAKMDVGFKGNPNIGSVVLNQVALSQDFNDVIGSFGSGDRVFIISSIFGGTGAAGFPLILKNLRAISNNVNNFQYVKDAVIGAVSVLPYFNVKNKEGSEIDSSTFISKTKAALSYYDRNMTEANALYYIADNLSESKQYPNSEGGTTQRNEAHFVELAAALSVIDFSWQGNLTTINGKPRGTIYKEFGIKNDAKEITFGDLEAKTNNNIKKTLTQFTLFCKYMDEKIFSSYKDQPWAIAHKFDDNFIHSPAFQSDLEDLKKAYFEWLTELSNNHRAFEPYDLTQKPSKLFELIKGEKPAKTWSLKTNYDLFDDCLNDLQSKVKDDLSKPLQSFMELFFLATDKLVKLKFRIV